MKIIRANTTTTTGDLTITDGNIVIATTGKALIVKDQLGTSLEVKGHDEDGTKTLTVTPV